MSKKRFLFPRAISRRWPAIAAASATLLAVLVGSGTALASSIKYVPDVVIVPAGSNGDVHTNVPCPPSHPQVTGGAVGVSGDNSFQQLSIADTSAMIGSSLSDGIGWHGSLLNGSGADAVMSVIAICSEPSHLTNVPDVKSVPAHESRALTVPCPAGTKVIGGGVDGGGGGLDVASTEPAGHHAWFGVVNNRTDNLGLMDVDAECAPESGNYVYVHSDPKPLPDNSEVSARARCPSGTNVTGGGVENSGSTQTAQVGAEIVDTQPFDTDADIDNHPDDGWQATAQRVLTGGVGGTMQTFAICKVPASDFFSGSFTKFDPSVGPATMSFALTHDGSRIHDWTWHHIPVQCAHGVNDVNSSHYRADVRVVDHHFHIQGVRDPEGFKTTLDGTLTHHDTKAHGTLSMKGPEPPTSTRCHGTDDWSANVQ